MEVKTNGFRSTGKRNSADKNEFAGFKPKNHENLQKLKERRLKQPHIGVINAVILDGYLLSRNICSLLQYRVNAGK